MWRIQDVYPRSRILIFTHPGSRISDPGSRISDPGSKNSNKRRWWKKICCHTFFFGVINFTKLNYFIFEMLKKRIWANFQRIIKLFTQKIVSKLSKIWVWDPGSEIRKKPIPDPGSRGQKGTGSRIWIHNTGKNHRYYHRSRLVKKEYQGESHFLSHLCPNATLKSFLHSHPWMLTISHSTLENLLANF